MPYVLKHHTTAEIFTCTLINKYDLPYHGTKFWDHLDEAQNEHTAFLDSVGASPEDWSIHEVEENDLKMYNVKLNNNSSRKLYLNDQGKPVVQT